MLAGGLTDPAIVNELHPPPVISKPRTFIVANNPNDDQKPKPQAPKPKPIAKVKEQPRPVIHYEIYEVTAYTAGPESTGKRPGDEGYGITTSGNRVKEGLTVSCPKELTLGTRIVIEGVGERRCDDRGGAIKGKRLDLYIADLDRALNFGRQKLKVRIVSR